MSTTADEVHDLEHVAFVHRSRFVLGARYDFAIELYRYGPFRKPQLNDDIPHALRVADVTRFAVYDNSHGFLT
jgi:hypothetical protein